MSPASSSWTETQRRRPTTSRPPRRSFPSPSRAHASLMVTLIVVSIPISFLNELNSMAALVLVRGADFLSIFEKPQRDALAMLFLNLHNHGFVVAEMFWGLWLFPLALL